LTLSVSTGASLFSKRLKSLFSENSTQPDRPM
jgi:hypothetical protein